MRKYHLSIVTIVFSGHQPLKKPTSAVHFHVLHEVERQVCGLSCSWAFQQQVAMLWVSQMWRLFNAIQENAETPTTDEMFYEFGIRVNGPFYQLPSFRGRWTWSRLLTAWSKLWKSQSGIPAKKCLLSSPRKTRTTKARWLETSRLTRTSPPPSATTTKWWTSGPSDHVSQTPRLLQRPPWTQLAPTWRTRGFRPLRRRWCGPLIPKAPERATNPWLTWQQQQQVVVVEDTSPRCRPQPKPKTWAWLPPSPLQSPRLTFRGATNPRAPGTLTPPQRRAKAAPWRPRSARPPPSPPPSSSSPTARTARRNGGSRPHRHQPGSPTCYRPRNHDILSRSRLAASLRVEAGGSHQTANKLKCRIDLCKYPPSSTYGFAAALWQQVKKKNALSGISFQSHTTMQKSLSVYF